LLQKQQTAKLFTTTFNARDCHILTANQTPAQSHQHFTQVVGVPHETPQTGHQESLAVWFRSR